jgi:uncharacterized membrane protein
VTSYHVALFLHLLGVAGLFSGMTVAAVALAAARRRELPSEVALLLGLTRVGVALVGAGILVALITGFWLLDETGYGLNDGWVAEAIGLLVLASLLGALGGQRPKKARLLAEQGDPEASHRLGDPLTLVLNGAAAACVLAILALMIWKP